ncbi:MAG: galactose-1-phosphate uridylyltransferase, partial [Clostridiaceae bacterium]|nr:galactose-1-phosphate uridylyltransferase [Clostridiaceae bacterium]
MKDKKAKAAEYVERLLRFGIQNEMMSLWDLPQIRNQLLDILRLDKPLCQPLKVETHDELPLILEVLLDYAVDIGLINNTVTERDLLDARLMAQLMPRQSELVNIFRRITMKEGIKAATDYFYRLSLNSNYIRMDRISRNIHWIADTKYGIMEITINLSKPEKDPKEIEAQRNMVKSDYPKCLLCLENVGYAGRLNH